MATWFDNSAGGTLDQTLSDISTRATRVILVHDYAQGEDYATVTGRALCTVTISGADFGAIANGASNSREMQFLGASGTADTTNATPTNLHIVLTNGADTIIAVTDEVSEQAIYSGNTVNFPAFTIGSRQPTQVV